MNHISFFFSTNIVYSISIGQWYLQNPPLLLYPPHRPLLFLLTPHSLPPPAHLLLLETARDLEGSGEGLHVIVEFGGEALRGVSLLCAGTGSGVGVGAGLEVGVSAFWHFLIFYYLRSLLWISCVVTVAVVLVLENLVGDLFGVPRRDDCNTFWCIGQLTA